MAKQTIQEKLRQALIAAGGVEVPARTAKYIVIRTNRHPRAPEKVTTNFWFLGRSGALRVGSTEAATKSTPAEKTKQHLLATV